MTERWWFTDRADGGRQLGRMLAHADLGRVAVLGIPRGGVPVAAKVAEALDARLDVVLVRKLGLPDDPEVAMGAIGEGGITVIDSEIRSRARVTAHQFADVEATEVATLRARAEQLGPHRYTLGIEGSDVVIVDDGIATGATMTAACGVARRMNAAHVYAAAPVGSAAAIRALDVADRVFCLLMAEDFFAVGRYYRDFGPTTDDEVAGILDDSYAR